MRRTRLFGLARVGCAAIASLLLIQSSASAQDVTEPALKAAFIYNFAKFTEWPTDAAPAQEPFVLCVLGDTAVGDALVQAVKARVLAGHSMSVSIMTPGGPPRKCHLLYVSGVTAGQAAQLVAGLRDVPVLTISDLEGFTELGGIARFFFEHGQLRFSVNLESAERVHLHMSSKLLALSIRK
jgi:hypothetical protein